MTRPSSSLARAEGKFADLDARHPELVGTGSDVATATSNTSLCQLDLATVTRTSEATQLYAALDDARLFLEEAQRLSHTGSFVWNPATDETVASAELREIFGFERGEEVSPALMATRIHPDDREVALERFNGAVSNHVRCDSEHRLLLPDGSLKHVHVVGHPVNGRADGIAYVGAVIDITAAKNAEDSTRLAEQARLAQDTAEAANRAKDALANVSHEIRTPLNAILGMTDLVLETELTDEQRLSMSTVKSAAENLVVIIDDLLDFAKIEAGKVELVEKEFSVRSLAFDTARSLAIRAHRKGLELVCDVDSDVPDELHGDSGRLRQVLLNLLGNAVKFTERGEIVVHVELAERGATPLLRFSVSDTGLGIAKDKQRVIFGAFEQADASTTRRYGGTGLGLTIAARLVALLGGNIDVVSEPGRGSVFSFTARLSSPRNLERARELSKPLKGQRVLLVEDAGTSRAVLTRSLEELGAGPTIADAATALAELRAASNGREPYSVALVDSRLGGTDGLALVRQIRAEPAVSTTPIVLLVSLDRPDKLARFRDLGGKEYVQKPVLPEELCDAILAASGPRVASLDRTAALFTSTTRPLDVLVAEDDELNRELMRQLLGRRGHRVQFARNGREALYLVGRNVFDAVLLDVHLAELDGFSVIAAIREVERASDHRLPVIAVTARSRPEDREACLAAGMDAFLTKPISASRLWATLDEVVAPRASRELLIDASVLHAACDEDEAVLDSIRSAFRARLPIHLAALKSACDERDWPRLREAAHRMLGLFSAFSPRAGRMASELEECATTGGPETTLLELVGSLAVVTPNFIRELDEVSLDGLRTTLLASS